jgi:hypothetical protein
MIPVIMQGPFRLLTCQLTADTELLLLGGPKLELGQLAKVSEVNTLVDRGHFAFVKKSSGPGIRSVTFARLLFTRGSLLSGAYRTIVVLHSENVVSRFYQDTSRRWFLRRLGGRPSKTGS